MLQGPFFLCIYGQNFLLKIDRNYIKLHKKLFRTVLILNKNVLNYIYLRNNSKCSNSFYKNFIISNKII